ncbi:MAG: hypothetical protein KGS61_07885 [Verrucomicrobia bacterium]|nr:hypothetical protein [Verrucomicrobiota bacterium]
MPPPSQPAGRLFRAALEWTCANPRPADRHWKFLVAVAALFASAAVPVNLSGADAPLPLPLSEVVLYSNGVGYFQRDGQVDGRAEVDLRFKADNINDLLKSLVVQDLGGGKVSTVTYASRDPLARTLKSFSIDLTANPSLGQLLDQVRGERVEVATPNVLTGTLVGVEKKQEQVGDTRVVEREYLNLLADDGLRSVPMTQVQRVRLLNPQLDQELQQALATLAAGHDTQKKTVAITFDGAGQRKVRVAYILESPVWKTSYRLVLHANEPPFLQGWAIVENTTDDDWTNVRLSLISGRPISFIMDLYQPLYVPRPTVVPELYASLRPQVYDENMAGKPEEETVAAATEMAKRPMFEMMGRAARKVQSLAAAPAIAVAGPAGGVVAGGVFNLQQGVQSLAEALKAGELFQYEIQAPVTLARQKSALLPIVNQPVEGEKLSIYNQAVQAKYPLNGLRLKNTTALNLMQGPITVFDGGLYAGDARIEDLAPGQERLISYALDLKTEVEPQTTSGPEELTSVHIRKGTLLATRKLSETKTYLIRNRDQQAKTVLVEHPFRPDWQLVEPKEPTERTRDVYRFRVKVEPDKTAKLTVREEKQLTEQVRLADTGLDTIQFYLQVRKLSPKLKAALDRVVELRDRLAHTTADRARRERRIGEITQEQGRIRENMARLAQNSELYARYVKKLDQQETELETLRQEIESLRTTEAKQQRELNDYLLNLQVD